jgi:cell division topological specificity factor
MGLFSFFSRPRVRSADIARERLQIVLSHERASRDAPDFLPILQKELVAVVARFVEVRDDTIRVNVGKSGETRVLEINIEIDGAKLALTAAGKNPLRSAAARTAPPPPIAKPAAPPPAAPMPAPAPPIAAKPAAAPAAAEPAPAAAKSEAPAVAKPPATPEKFPSPENPPAARPPATVEESDREEIPAPAPPLAAKDGDSDTPARVAKSPGG